jgi:hypothetical protein
VARQDGEFWVERDELREHLFPEEYLSPRSACPIEVPKCRHCDRLSHRGWEDMICARCEVIRTKIETAASARERRGWKGPPLITDELLLAIHRRLASADRTTAENAEREQRKATRYARTRTRDSSRPETDDAEADTVEFAEAA